MTDRIPLDHLNSDQYDRLCARLGAAEAAVARVQDLVEECEARGVSSGYPLTVTRLRDALDQPGPATAGHRYLSTGCYHGDHAYCQSMTGLNGAKRPASCKFCQAACQCGCHGEADQPGPLTPAEEARLAQSGVDTPDCDCGHEGMGVSWHGDDCPWRRRVVDCPGRPTPG